MRFMERDLRWYRLGRKETNCNWKLIIHVHKQTGCLCISPFSLSTASFRAINEGHSPRKGLRVQNPWTIFFWPYKTCLFPLFMQFPLINKAAGRCFYKSACRQLHYFLSYYSKRIRPPRYSMRSASDNHKPHQSSRTAPV